MNNINLIINTLFNALVKNINKMNYARLNIIIMLQNTFIDNKRKIREKSFTRRYDIYEIYVRDMTYMKNLLLNNFYLIFHYYIKIIRKKIFTYTIYL